MTIEQYNDNQKNLPDFMKDFHDQKDLFKCIHDCYLQNDNFKRLPNSWVDNHVFVVDYFLWFMSMHGYKLQKIREDIDFCDIKETIAYFKEKRYQGLPAAINPVSNPPELTE